MVEVIGIKIQIEITEVKIQIEVDLSVEDEIFLGQVFHVFRDLDLVNGQVQEGRCAIDVEELDIEPTHANSMQISYSKTIKGQVPGITNLLPLNKIMAIFNQSNPSFITCISTNSSARNA